MSISQSFIDSGFSQALIRKKHCTQSDYSSVFFFNLIIGIFFYLVLFFTASAISIYFKEPQLKLIVQLLGIDLIINALTVVQFTQLTRRIDFKLQTHITVLASFGSGLISIVMALKGYGVWSLVAKLVAQHAFNTIFLWYWNSWRPSWSFDVRSLKELYSFGSKLFISGLIDSTFTNIYYFVIGKYFSAVELGYYTQADSLQGLPSKNLTNVIQRVSYPVLTSIQANTDRLKSAYEKLIRSTMLISFVLMIGLAAVAKPLVVTLIGTKWLPSVIYLQLLCFVGMFYPLHALNLNLLNVQGRSDLFLRLEIIKKLLAVPIIIIAIFFGIKMLIFGMLVISLIAYFLNSYWSGQLIGYSSLEQLRDILPSFLLALSGGIVAHLTGIFLNLSHLLTLIIQITVSGIFVVCISEILRFSDYLYLKDIVKDKILIEYGTT